LHISIYSSLQLKNGYHRAPVKSLSNGYHRAPVFSSNIEEVYKVFADFPITINLLFRYFSKQATTLVALTYEAGEEIAPAD